MSEYCDAAKRIANSMNLHTFAGSAGKYAAYNLGDGTTDNMAYDTRRDAIRSQRHNANNYMYLCVTPDGMTPKAADALLRYWRWVNARNSQVTDPDFNFDSSVPHLKSTRAMQAKELVRSNLPVNAIERLI